MDSQLAALIAFLRKETLEKHLPITRETLIEKDLGVTGDDAGDLIIAFSKEFKVDVSNFDPAAYFHDESAVWWFRHRKIKPLTVGHLEKAMAAGRLDEAVIASLP